jgi:hypothetical protein
MVLRLLPSVLSSVLVALEDDAVLRLAVVRHCIYVFVVSGSRRGLYPATLSVGGRSYGFWQHLPLWEVAITLRELANVNVVSSYEFPGGRSIRCLSAILAEAAQWAYLNWHGGLWYGSDGLCLEWSAFFLFCSFHFPLESWACDLNTLRMSLPLWLPAPEWYVQGRRVEVVDLKLRAFVMGSSMYVSTTSWRALPVPMEVFGLSTLDGRVKFLVRCAEGVKDHGRVLCSIPAGWLRACDECSLPFIVGVRLPRPESIWPLRRV